MCGLSPRSNSFVCVGVVVVLLELEAGVVDRIDLHVQADLGAGLLHQLGELQDRERLGELVVHAHLATLGGVRDGELDALQGVEDVEVAARLAALAVHRERMADHRLQAEPVQRGAEHVVVVEPRHQPVVEHRLVGLDAVHDALVEVGGAHAPDPTREVDVVGVVHLRQVVHRARAASGTAGCPCGRCGRSRGSPPRCRCSACRTRPSCRASRGGRRGRRSRIAKITFSVFTTLFVWVKTACSRSFME